MSQLTKAAIINAFIKILKDKPFEKITINDIKLIKRQIRVQIRFLQHRCEDMS